MRLFDIKKDIFIHIPKNAGTAMNIAIAKSKGEYDPTKLYKCGGHKTALQHKEEDPILWKNSYKFCIVRNPWDRVVSCYEYAKMDKSYYHNSRNIRNDQSIGIHPDYKLLKNKTFEKTIDILYNDFLNGNKRLQHKGWISQHHFICNKYKKILVDKIFRYENFSNDLEFLTLFPDFPVVNSSKHEDYKSYYTSQDLINKVSTIYAVDINLFNYKF